MKNLGLCIVVILMLVVPGNVSLAQQKKATPKIVIPRNSIKIFPNPVDDYFQLSNQEGIKAISVSNIAGKEVKRFNVNSDSEYSIAELRKGIYIVRLFDQKDEPVTVLRLSKG